MSSFWEYDRYVGSLPHANRICEQLRQAGSRSGDIEQAEVAGYAYACFKPYFSSKPSIR